MKIATFNINNVNRPLPNLLAWTVDGILIGCIYLSKRQSTARTEIRLQARVVQAPAQTRRHAPEVRRARHPCGRLQRRTAAVRYLQDQVMGQ
jgi:hypothetical protein